MLEELREHILAAVSIGGRMYPDNLPQMPVLPAITYQVISETRRATMGQTDNLPRVRVQVDSWATTRAESITVADAVKTAIDGFNGMMGDSPGVMVGGIFAQSALWLRDPETGSYRVSRDFAIWARE